MAALEVIKLKGVYEFMEEITDKFEDVALLLRDLAVKYGWIGGTVTLKRDTITFIQVQQRLLVRRESQRSPAFSYEKR